MNPPGDRPTQLRATLEPGRSTARRLVPEAGGSPGVDRLAALAAQLLKAPTAVVSLHANEDGARVARVAGTSGIAPADAPTILCAVVAQDEQPLNIADTTADVRAEALPAGLTDLVRSYLGVPMRADDREVVGALCVFDQTSRTWSPDDVRVLEQLASAAATELELAALTREYTADRARWDAAIAAAGIGNFDWDLTTGRLVWDQALIELFGYDGDEKFDESIEAFNARVHHDDVADVTAKLQRAIDALGPYEAEYRIVLPGGIVRRIQARGHAMGRDGVADRVAGSAWDVSATRGAEEHAANILEAMPVGYVSLDADLRVTTVNSTAERLLHATRLELIDRPLRGAVPTDAARTLAEHCRAVRDSRYSIEVEVYFEAPIAAWLEVRVWPESSGIGLYLTDITERREAEELAEQLAEYDRATAEALQDAMLAELPQVGGLEIDTRYRAAASRNKVGGDWYDAVLQAGGSTVLIVGDVTGHDIRAAASMGQVRSMLRVLAWQGDERPEAVLAHLDRAVAALHRGVLATAIVARVEQTDEQAARSERTVRWCSAGHPPPVLVDADGTATVLPADGIMLGVRPGETRAEFTTGLAEGATLLLYTDGLIERRGTVLDEGLEQVRLSAQRHRALPVGEFLDAVLADVVDADETDDDVVVLALRAGSTGS